MKRMYTGMYKMSRNEAFLVFAVSLIGVALYSAWGAYILHGEKSATAPSQALTAQR